MIFEALQLLKTELGNYIESKDDLGSASDVVLGNVALIESEEGEHLSQKIIINLVNVEEESALKNIRVHSTNSINGKVIYKNPPVHLNLYILFCANYQGAENSYPTALKRLAHIFQFFQGKNVFNLNNTPTAQNLDASFNLVLDLYTLTFEQLNHLWGSLGGKQLPFVMYKARLVIEEDIRPLRSGLVIEEIHSSETIQ